MSPEKGTNYFSRKYIWTNHRFAGDMLVFRGVTIICIIHRPKKFDSETPPSSHQKSPKNPWWNFRSLGKTMSQNHGSKNCVDIKCCSNQDTAPEIPLASCSRRDVSIQNGHFACSSTTLPKSSALFFWRSKMDMRMENRYELHTSTLKCNVYKLY